MWKKLMKKRWYWWTHIIARSHLGCTERECKPNETFLDHVYLGCTQRECKPNKNIHDQYREIFESRISAAATEKLPGWEKPHAKTMAWSYDMEGHARKCVERYCELANKKDGAVVQSLESMHRWPSFQRRRIEIRWRIVRSVLSSFFWNAYTWHVLDDPIFYGQWTSLSVPSQNGRGACDKSLNRWISYIHHTCEYKHYCHVGNTALQCRLGLLQDSDFAGDLEDSKSTSGGTLCIFGSHTFVPIGWMCKKQTSVSHSSTESEIISLDAGSRLDGLPALELWDLIVSVLGNVSRVSDRSEKPESDDHKHHKSHNKIDAMEDIDSVPSNVQSARQETLLYVFEDNEAVTKMIMKGRNPTMRHVSRTHRVALDWLVDRINLDSKNPNQIHWHREPTRRHTDKGKFHTWWMESSFVFVQHPPFQFYQLFLKWCRKERKKVQVKKRVTAKSKPDDELSLAMQRKGSSRASFHCIRKPLENRHKKSISSDLANWAASQNGETCDGR